jgi:ATP-dependent helicase HrpB
MRLPIYELEERIVAALKERRRLILSAPTGSGKSTQVPQMLLRHGLLQRGQAVVLQPRRIAARLLAARVAEELGTPLGREAGYQIRFENVSGPETRIRFVTEGLLLRQMIQDPALSGVSALLFDEFHERHLYGDLTLARALDLQESRRPDLLVSVMSATLDEGPLARYLEPCARLSSEGRTHPVRIEYSAESRAPVWEQAADAFARYVVGGGPGDLLVFMPGGYEIFRTIEAIRARKESSGFVLLPLHGELPPQDQDAAVARYDRRKAIVATNVAETSITIDGIRAVIDSGLARIARHDPYRGINTLWVQKISRASADQRAGRAGRTAPGACIRLWPEREQAERPLREDPEIKRVDLCEAVLTLKAAGVRDLRAFRWLEPPGEKALAHAEGLLRDLGALQGPDLTELGRRMLAFPMHPRFSRMLLAASELDCVREAALIAAIAQGRDLLLRSVDDRAQSAREEIFGRRPTSDLIALTRAWSYAERQGFRVDACDRAGIHAGAARQAVPLREQLLKIARGEGLEPGATEAPEEAVRKCVLIGFSDRVARRLDAATLRCELVGGRRGVLARESVVRSPLLAAAEVREVEGKELQTILTLATAVEPGWLKELFPSEIARRLKVEFDPATRRVTAEEQTLFRDLPIETRSADPPPEEASKLLAEEVLRGRLSINGWDESVEQWILRVNLLARHCPELEIAPVDEAARRLILEQLCHGASSHKEIKDRSAREAVRGWLSQEKQALVDEHAPERVALGNGKSPKLRYVPDGPPTIAARIQELYGVTRTPKIAMGRIAPAIQILAPSMRPVQITQDLEGFWRDHYPALKRDLQRRYPKHEWR